MNLNRLQQIIRIEEENILRAYAPQLWSPDLALSKHLFQLGELLNPEKEGSDTK